MQTIHDEAREKTFLAFTYGEDGAFLSAARCLIDAAVLYLQREREMRTEMQETGLLPPTIPSIWHVLFEGALALGLTSGDAIKAFAELQREKEPELTIYAELADTLDIVREGVLEVDDDALVSKGDDDGAYVSAWLWVSNADIGLEPDAEDEEDEGEEAAQEGEDGDR